MIIVQGRVRLAGGEIDRLRAAAKEMMTATTAEPGCLAYAFAADLFEPDVLHVVERWTDDAALAAHFATPHMAAFNQVLQGAQILEIAVRAHTADDGRPLVG